MPRAFLPSTNTARIEGRGIKGGYAPFAGGQDFFEVLNQEVPGESLVTFFSQESHPGAEHYKAMLSRSTCIG